jgi:hypothetical protein
MRGIVFFWEIWLLMNLDEAMTMTTHSGSVVKPKKVPKRGPKKLPQSKELTELELKSPYASIPNCAIPYPKIEKRYPDIKGILCPMIRDEEGFLTEWIAFYKLMGFDHIMFFDDGSTDKTLEEIQPWVDIGFVSVRSNWSLDNVGLSPQWTKNHFLAVMAVKSLLETECKLQAIEWGYHYFMSLDLDEYMFPLLPSVTVVDQLHELLSNTERNSYCLDKYAFPGTLHLLEPVDLLTIEAYQSRTNLPNKMNSFVVTAKKCGYPLYLRPNFTLATQRYVAECCRFHGCEDSNKKVNSTFCSDNFHEKKLIQNPASLKSTKLFQINHYARSLEKFMLKQKTWHTSPGRTEVYFPIFHPFLTLPPPPPLPVSVSVCFFVVSLFVSPVSQESARNGYTMRKYFERSFGWTYDPVITRYSCQIREIIREVTKEPVFYRRGDFWYRNPEFGREINDTSKRGPLGGSMQSSPVKSPYHFDRFQIPPSQSNPQDSVQTSTVPS